MKKFTPILQPQDIPERFKQAWNLYDAEGIAALFYEDADFINVTGKWWENKKEIWKAHDFGLRLIFQNPKLQILRVKLKMLNHDIAIVHAHIRILGQTQIGEAKAENRETMFLFVARKQKDSWLCESAQNTDIVFGKQTNLRDGDGELKAVSYREKIRFDRNIEKED